jgi:diguanylate cyclase (GGDEF)-like protein/PAS domain S-box-containing protein
MPALTLDRPGTAELLADLEALRGVIDAIPNPIFIKDEDSRFVVVNRAMCRLMGHAFGDLVGHTDYDFIPRDQADVFRANDLMVLASNEPNENEEPITDGEGNVRTIITRKQRLVLAGGRRFIVGCIADITEVRRAEALVRYSAEHDHLTGLANRALFHTSLQTAIVGPNVDRSGIVLLLIDLDGFKKVNDAFGHATGDSLLIQVAATLSRLVGPGDLVARLGGDEFAIIHRCGPGAEPAANLVTTVIGQLSQPMLAGGRRVEISASIGVATILPDIEDAGVVMRRADLALYSAKQEGRNTWRLFEPAMEVSYLASRFLEDELRTALESASLSLNFQPLHDALDLAVTGFEVLLRWAHPLRPIGPAEFIAVAERSGLIAPLAEWTLREACGQAASWPRPLGISVNISPVHFAQCDMPALLRSVIAETGIDPGRVSLELTETALIADIARARRVFSVLRDIGLHLVLDDFGAGYSSLQILKSLPFDRVKIDRSLLHDVGRTVQANAIIGAILRLTRTLDLAVIAEGVETEEQLALLRNEGCQQVQGFLFGRPAPIAEYASLIGAGNRVSAA